jgi:hypothetical protein
MVSDRKKRILMMRTRQELDVMEKDAQEEMRNVIYLPRL